MEEIHDSSKPEMWRYCPSKQNPADIASRGSPGSKLSSSKLWLQGPEFLLLDKEQWPSEPTIKELPLDDPELQHVYVTEETVEQRTCILELIDSCSNWTDALNRVSIIIKFVRYLQHKIDGRVIQTAVTVADWKEARDFIVRLVQAKVFAKEVQELRSGRPVHKSSAIRNLTPSLGPDGIIRVGGRLEEALHLPYNTRHPMILPKHGNITSAIVRHTHASVGHAGTEHTLAKIREDFWIPDGKSVVKSHTKPCITCRKIFGRMMSQKMSQLPESRVTPLSPPFTVTGADVFGPILVKQARSTVKRYGLLLTCFSTRAVHIKILRDLTTDSLINALRRFYCRRSALKEVWADNGTNLVGGSRELRRNILEWNNTQISEALRQQGITWRFQTPYAPHTSGVWERLVRSVKRTLKSTLTSQTVNEDVLHTALTEVEGLLNSRPITSVSDDPNDCRALSPCQLLVQEQMNSLPPGVFDSGDVYRSRWRQVQYLANLWWKRWMREYLPMLQITQKWTQERRNAAIGDLVLLSDDAKIRGHWPLGRITNTYPGNDGLVRSVDVKTSTGIYRRPITKLCLLEGAN